ncbi:Putative acetyltransferase OgpAT [Fulvia fulva]|uniref:Acetyltransferase OgpAT n=1 Tax=Passalora fulva TaxID=5499 RepID=A0A9Q8P496_PASFU|nr:Putative acetyltransferase OgpAT [Fulvia fulva]KAK4634485.1 putative acetyltransferase OgpAT [Fulvia fulva]KAK4636878.1 putative acetyltransferase OgpAT [Fulvia fulva]UJO12512.1 Putative acetyltransferase OgpAT [Fulvia fulva]WPV08239.1 Putative acetyltransferase OgpAT [Fulvia fulva]WPV23445.1 Putative acetyltransferase OgpAT [Fulvia fulva]
MANSVEQLKIRPFLPEDEHQMFTIFSDTALQGLHDAGEESIRVRYHIWCRPYIMLCPQHCFVLDDNGLAVGYIISTADSASFVKQWLDQYIPFLQSHDIVRPGPDVDTTKEDSVAALREIAHTPGEQLLKDRDLVDTFPGHLHIDIRPRWQGVGMGKRMVLTFLDHMKRSGCAGMHLGMAASNASTGKFYERFGFEQYTKVEDGTIMVKSLQT